MGTLLRIPVGSQALALGLLLSLGGGCPARADPPAGTGAQAGPQSSDAPATAPRENFLSTLKQAFNQDFDKEVVRGHFDVGSPPDTHRYYCLVNAKTGKTEPSGVAGQPVPRADGMTGIKASAVSVYSCAGAEQQGILVTAGYVLSAGAGTGVSAGGGAAMPAPVQKPPPRPAPDRSPMKIDVAGVKLGMSPDEVRAVLKSRGLLDYYESSGSLGHPDPTKDATAPKTGERFVNVVAAWTPLPISGSGGFPENAESYEVMFTPVPGKERALAIVHSVSYLAAGAVREVTLANALVKKYGGFADGADLPASPTWRIQKSGAVLTGDACNRRGIVGGLGGFSVGSAGRDNLALKTSPDEFRFQVDNCGVAIVTEDHVMASDSAPHEDRGVMRFTVSAYSPTIGFEGAAAAAQLIQAAGEVGNAAAVPPATDHPSPSL